MSLEFPRKQGFKLKKINRPIYVRNVDSSFNKEGLIKHIVKMSIYYQWQRERTEINVIEGQKWSVILGMLWLAYYNPEIDWRTGEVKIMRCSKECEKQWRPKQRKSRQQKQNEEEKRKEEEEKQEEKKKKPKKEKMMEIKKIAEEWEIWDKEKKVAKSEEEAKKLVPQRF